jgi:hypothetical protein
MRFSRTSIAAAVTIAALGILAAVALASGGSQTTGAPAPTAETDPPAQAPMVTATPSPIDDDGTPDRGPGDASATPISPAHDANDDRGGHENSGPGSQHSGRGGHGGDDDD